MRSRVEVNGLNAAEREAQRLLIEALKVGEGLLTPPKATDQARRRETECGMSATKDVARFDFFERQAKAIGPLTIRTYAGRRDGEAVLSEPGVAIASDEGDLYHGESLREAIDAFMRDEEDATVSERPNRAQLILNAKRLRAEMGQFLDDVRCWNQSDVAASSTLWLPSELFDAQHALDCWLETRAFSPYQEGAA